MIQRHSNNLIRLTENVEIDTLKMAIKKNVIILTPVIRALEEPIQI